MPAPRLLDKRTIQASIAADRKQEVDRGVKLAKSIDALNEQKAFAEQELDVLRMKTLTKIQQEIDARIIESNNLESLLVNLRRERIFLENPPDLTELREQLSERERKLDTRFTDLEEREQAIFLRENTARQKEAEIAGRQLAVTEQEKLAADHLEVSFVENDKASALLLEARNAVLQADTYIKDQYSALEKKEAEIAVQSQAVSTREKQVEEDEKQIISERRFLADQRATLVRAMKRIKNGTSTNR